MDRRVILYSQLLAELGPVAQTEDVLQPLSEQQSELEAALDEPCFGNPIAARGILARQARDMELRQVRWIE